MVLYDLFRSLRYCGIQLFSCFTLPVSEEQEQQVPLEKQSKPQCFRSIILHRRFGSSVTRTKFFKLTLHFSIILSTLWQNYVQVYPRIKQSHEYRLESYRCRVQSKKQKGKLLRKSSWLKYDSRNGQYDYKPGHAKNRETTVHF